MLISSAPRASNAVLLQEHQHIRYLAQSLERLALHLPDSMALVERHVAELQAVLGEHFAAEERSGMFDEIVQAHPELTEACRRLLDQHRHLLAELSRLADSSPEHARIAEQSGWAGRLRHVLVDLESHEEQENALLAQGVAADEGAPD